MSEQFKPVKIGEVDAYGKFTLVSRDDLDALRPEVREALERYGMTAHVECMDRGWWWFAVGRGEFPNYFELYNTADNATYVRLTTGKMARAAAECVMELLHSQPNTRN